VQQLILLNGPPGVGKSSLGRRYADDHPMTLALEIDAVRAMFGSWLAESERSGLAARELAVVMAVTHLRSGHDVVVPQLLTRREFVERLRSVTEAEGAQFREITLLDEREAVLNRANSRAEPDGGFSARALVARQGNSLEAAYDAFVEALHARPEAAVIESSSLDEAYAELLYHLGEGKEKAVDTA
jgi:predicted kinase